MAPVQTRKVASRLKAENKKLGKGLIVIASLIGFLAQVTQMSILYFGYRTTTQVHFILTKQISQHSLVLCVRYSDILDRKKLMKETGIQVQDVTDILDAVAQQAKLTVKQMFDYTPKSHEVIEGCFYRPSDWKLLTTNRTMCNYLFNVTRYLTQEFMCYVFNPVNLNSLSADAVTLSHFKQFVVYDISLRETFRRADFVLPIAFFQSYPYVSRSFSDVVILRKGTIASTVNGYNLINVFPNEFEIHKLEKPYDTGCIERHQDEYYICRRDCLTTAFEETNRIPLTEILPEENIVAYDMQPISTTDLEDPEFERRVNETYSRCHNHCFYTPCMTAYTKTTFRPLVFREFPLILSAMSPTEADVRTEAQARMSFVEYFSFICGCFGTWFGVSFFSLCRLDQFLKRNKRAETSSVSDTVDFHADQSAAWKQIRSQNWQIYADSLTGNPAS